MTDAKVFLERRKVSERDYQRGLRDGRFGTYNPPHEKGLLMGLLSNYSRSELEDRKDYQQGYSHGKRSR
jgi:hypothetical protein